MAKKPKKTDDTKVNTLAARYWREIERYDRSVLDWHTEGDQIEDVYADATRKGSETRKYAMLWANVETLKPAVYTKTPTILCSRRYKDKDKVARTAAELLERAVNTSFEMYGVNEAFKMVRDDRLLSGRGQAWVRYEAKLETYEDPDGTVDAETGEVVMHERLKDEKLCVDYVHWKDFGHNVARTWTPDVWLVWRIVYKTQEEITERFGSQTAARLSYNTKTPAQGSGSTKDDPENRCKVYELWDKARNQVAWMADGEKDFLEVGDPPINFQNFFPCPEPVYGTKTSKQLIPKPDYCFYRDQAKEINQLTDKIGRLTEYLQVKGFIPGAPSAVSDPLETALRDTSNTPLVQSIDDWSGFTSNGGSGKLIDWIPIEKFVQALQAMQASRAQLIQDVFQITGISDILRGMTDANETLGAQELKAQTGTRRIRTTKDDIARFCCDVGRLAAEVIAEKFEPETIAAMTGYKYVPQQGFQGRMALPGPMPGMGAPNAPQFMPPMQLPGNVTAMPGVTPMMGHNMPPMGDDGSNMDDPELVFDDRHIALLRDDRMRSFRIDIETDSTIQADENAEKAVRTEFMTAAFTGLERASVAIQTTPELAPVISEIMLFAARGMRVGRNMEEALERGLTAMAKGAMQRAQQPPPPDPRMITAEANAKAAEGKLALQAQGQQTNAQLALKKQQDDALLEKRQQDLDFSAEKRKQNLTAAAQARDHAASLLRDHS